MVGHLRKQAARQAHIEAHIELAKAYEHQLKDYARARYWTESALELVKNSSALNGQENYRNAYQRRQWLDELGHRLERLQHKEGLQKGTETE